MTPEKLTDAEQKVADAFLEMFPPGTLVFVWGKRKRTTEPSLPIVGEVGGVVVDPCILRITGERRLACVLGDSGRYFDLDCVCAVGHRFDVARGDGSVMRRGTT